MRMENGMAKNGKSNGDWLEQRAFIGAYGEDVGFTLHVGADITLMTSTTEIGNTKECIEGMEMEMQATMSFELASKLLKRGLYGGLL